MLGLARMAMRLACKRVYRDPKMADCILLMPRGEAEPYPRSAGAEYYRICDRIARGEKP
jgi:hypothetical protein